jgi:hypothetical protein
MRSRNAPRSHLVNGSRGVVVGFTDEDSMPIVEWFAGRRTTEKPVPFVVRNGDMTELGLFNNIFKNISLSHCAY